ncbi:hypothetical protein [Mesorhizobium sp.]|uniref:hypothetical protein n=1 Tax=Mesorhizobium sp. TaxID=1871066 RepID=UPI000FE59C5C|nr:hypothetical protein [Mesorhizobium sp.]RWC29183.1 MAG: hypothetical protein EOS27_16130 [Mesorhizobium sp.]TIX22543.1 MAG: hypothetical protein E5V35_25475 [Mesorhizobium sp.]
MAHKFSFRWIRIAAIGAALVLSTLSAQAQVICGGHSDLVAGLAQAFQQKQIGYGVVGQAAIVEVYVSASGTWTMLITDVQGRSCIFATGDGWQNTVPVTATAQGI